MTDNDEPFDPRNIQPKVKTRETRELEPVKSKASTDEGRFPLAKKLRDRWNNSERVINKNAQREMRLAKVDAKLQTTLDEAEIQKQTSSAEVQLNKNAVDAELVRSDRALMEETLEYTALASDQDGEIEYLRAKRRQERENELASGRMKGEAAKAKHDRKINPRAGKSKKEKAEERLHKRMEWPFHTEGPSV